MNLTALRTPLWAPWLGAAFALAILGLSSVPAKAMPSSETLWRVDKAIHAIEYGLFAWLGFRALVLRYRISLGLALFVTLLSCSLFGVLDESYQSTVPGRDASSLDALADFAGACFASLACLVFYSRRVPNPQV